MSVAESPMIAPVPFPWTPLRASLDERVTLLDLLDSVLNKGIVVSGDVTISVAGVDLVYIDLKAVVTSFEGAMRRGMVAS